MVTRLLNQYTLNIIKTISEIISLKCNLENKPFIMESDVVFCNSTYYIYVFKNNNYYFEIDSKFFFTSVLNTDYGVIRLKDDDGTDFLKIDYLNSNKDTYVVNMCFYKKVYSNNHSAPCLNTVYNYSIKHNEKSKTLSCKYFLNNAYNTSTIISHLKSHNDNSIILKETSRYRNKTIFLYDDKNIKINFTDFLRIIFFDEHHDLSFNPFLINSQETINYIILKYD